ncbi:hypothetical protein M3221_00350 [Domibacillus indicus]|uniref:hypothetical protein n=1 Tax=Domibacillus indicus TaxID=1437523 RepID=UPI0020403CE6|nr:hypothetical protein [Domibacillus indicus]MCM3786880.1 hypothetical protein [Domibacillus indicus]
MAWDLVATLKLQDRISKPLRDVNKHMDTLNRMTGETTSATMRFANALPAVATGSALAVSAIAPLGAAAGGLASSFGAAAGGLAAYGVVASSIIGKVVEASDELEKINEKIAQADTAKERLAAEKELAALYEGMSKSQARALKDLQSFKSFWAGFTKEFENPVFDAFGQSLQATKGLLNGLKPTITAVSGVVTQVMTDINKSMTGSTMQTFFAWLEGNAARSLQNFATMAGNTFAGVVNILDSFSSVGASMETRLVGLTERFRTWSETLATSNGFKAFIDYAKANGPVLMQVFSNLASIAGKTIVALMPIGSTLLQGLASFTSYVRDNFSVIAPIVGSVIAAFAGFKIITGVLTLVRGAIAVFGVLTKVFKVVKTAFTLVRLAMLLFPGTWLVAAIGAVIAIGVALYKNWDKVKAKSIEVFNKVKSTIGDAMDSAKAKVSAFFEPLLDFISRAKSRFDDLTSALKGFSLPDAVSSVLSGAGKIVSAITGGGGGSGGVIPGNYHGMEKIPYDNYVTRLHKDEAVLNRDQAAAWRAGRSGGNTIYLNVAYNGGQKLDKAEMDRFAAYMNRRLAEVMDGGA